MPGEYSIEVCRKLQQRFRDAGVHRPMRVKRYDADQELTYDITGVISQNKARVRVVVEDFVGGGFAGQVYRVRLQSLEAKNGPIVGLEAGQVYAIKIFVPPSAFSRLFRNILYWLGFQGAFQLQVNPTAARAGALWQKFIRRAAAVRLGDERAVVDVHATFVDENLGSCGELSEWIDGRTWRLEVDDRLDLLKKWRRAKAIDETLLGSPEYRAKRRFMADFVRLLHDVGARELARQYEWWTCKSQPNCLKRRETDSDASGGLVAVDFKAGLSLLPFLPMSPGDFKLIAQGVMSGSLVQFDRGNLKKLDAFVEQHGDEFAEMRELLGDLKSAERVYRDSLVDITHNHVRLLYSRRLWSTIFDSAVTKYRVRNLLDETSEQRLRSSRMLTLMFCVIGVIPFLGKLIRRIWGRPGWRRHYSQMLTSFSYFRRALRGRIAEKLIIWHRAGRVSAHRARMIAERPLRFLCHLPLSILPAGLHRFLTDWQSFKDKLHYIFVRPLKLYFSSRLREQWLRDMVQEGRKNHILTDEDADTILSQLKERYIQRYLVSLVVHLMTLPLTQIVSVIVAWIYFQKTGDKLGAGGILVLFQIVPISPGSIARGLYAVGIAVYDRSFKDYNVAVFLSFVKYIGYLGFPIQMTYHYPALARFMAAHWATQAVHIVPVFGERGALLEHWVFRVFYNWPLTIRRRMRRRAEVRAKLKARYWHVGLYACIASAVLALADYASFREAAGVAILGEVWWLGLVVPLLVGGGVTIGCGGATLGRRIIVAAVGGLLMALLYTAGTAVMTRGNGAVDMTLIAKCCFWRIFAFSVLSTIGAMLTELLLPEPRLQQDSPV
ncbi:MAG: hypothetical protein ACYSUP_11795 [Planctomycetota bacterium]|jgi:hypothetical protein